MMVCANNRTQSKHVIVNKISLYKSSIVFFLVDEFSGIYKLGNSKLKYLLIYGNNDENEEFYPEPQRA